MTSTFGATVIEQRLALAVDAARLGAWTWDMATGITTWDERLEEMHGLPPGGFGGTFEDWMASLHPDDRDACVGRVEEALAKPGPYVLIHRTIWPDGSLHIIECRGTVLVDADGQPIGTTGIAFDVTMRERLAQTMQEALLPTSFRCPPGASVAARYRTATGQVDVGGDWYAVIALPDRRLGLAIGDVAGHGLAAIADMAAARFSLRALALTDPRPEVVLDRLNRVVRVFESDAMITTLYGIVDLEARTWTYASAGHVPAMIRDADGAVSVLDTPNDPPLGVADTFRTHEVSLPEHSTLLLYTDGLIERRPEPITCGIGRLARAYAGAPADPQQMCDSVIDSMVGPVPHEDDVAVLAAALDATT